MKIEFVLRGTSPLLCHNPQMVDPDFPLNRELKALAGKRKKTEEDYKRMEWLEWYGGLYTASIGGETVVSQPSAKLRKCLINAARITKQGKQIERAVIMTQLHLPLIYDGSESVTDIEAELKRLQAKPEFNSRLSVGIGGKRVMRVRPQFFPWALVAEAEFITDAGLNFEELAQIADLAGRAERIGDNRVNGYGAFSVVVRPVTPKGRSLVRTVSGIEKFVDEFHEKDQSV